MTDNNDDAAARADTVEHVRLRDLQTTAEAILFPVTQSSLGVHAPNHQGRGVVPVSVHDVSHIDPRNGDGVTITPQWIVPMGDIMPHSRISLWCHGQGVLPAAAQGPWFDVNGIGGWTRATFTNSVLPPGTPFWFRVQADIMADQAAINVETSITATIQSRIMSNPGAVTVIALSLNRSIEPFNRFVVTLRSGISQQGGVVESFGSTYTRHGGIDAPEMFVGGGYDDD